MTELRVITEASCNSHLPLHVITGWICNSEGAITRNYGVTGGGITGNYRPGGCNSDPEGGAGNAAFPTPPSEASALKRFPSALPSKNPHVVRVEKNTHYVSSSLSACPRVRGNRVREESLFSEYFAFEEERYWADETFLGAAALSPRPFRCPTCGSTDVEPTYLEADELECQAFGVWRSSREVSVAEKLAVAGHEGHTLIVVSGRVNRRERMSWLLCVDCTAILSAVPLCGATTKRNRPCEAPVRTDLGFDRCNWHIGEPLHRVTPEV